MRAGQEPARQTRLAGTLALYRPPRPPDECQVVPDANLDDSSYQSLVS